MVVEDFQEEGFPLSCLLKLVGLARSTYYYISKGIKPGKRSSTFVSNSNGTRHPLLTIKQEIETLLSGEFVDYGYYKTYIYLTQDLGYKIGSCSVYKLMKANSLLKYQRAGRIRGKRNWVKDLVPNPGRNYAKNSITRVKQKECKKLIISNLYFFCFLSLHLPKSSKILL